MPTAVVAGDATIKMVLLTLVMMISTMGIMTV